jgi:hypothetical protein
LRRRSPPGLPKGWSDPPPIDLRALAFARSSHRPSCPKARRAMPVFGRRLGRPNPLPFDTDRRSPDVRSHTDPKLRRTGARVDVDRPVAPAARCSFRSGHASGSPVAVPPRPRCPANRTPLPESKPGLPASRLRCPSTPFTLTRLPVPSRWRRRTLPLGAVGVLRRSLPGNSVPVATGYPATRYPERVVSRSDRTRSHLVDRTRFRSSITRRCSTIVSVSRPRLACAARYVAYLRERETPGQEVFSNPQGYPRNFSSIPRNPPVVHHSYTPSCTGLSPDVHTRRRSSAAFRLTFGSLPD